MSVTSSLYGAHLRAGTACEPVSGRGREKDLQDVLRRAISEANSHEAQPEPAWWDLPEAVVAMQVPDGGPARRAHGMGLAVSGGRLA